MALVCVAPRLAIDVGIPLGRFVGRLVGRFVGKLVGTPGGVVGGGTAAEPFLRFTPTVCDDDEGCPLGVVEVLDPGTVVADDGGAAPFAFGATVRDVEMHKAEAATEEVRACAMRNVLVRLAANGIDFAG